VGGQGGGEEAVAPGGTGTPGPGRAGGGAGARGSGSPLSSTSISSTPGLSRRTWRTDLKYWSSQTSSSGAGFMQWGQSHLRVLAPTSRNESRSKGTPWMHWRQVPGRAMRDPVRASTREYLQSCAPSSATSSSPCRSSRARRATRATAASRASLPILFSSDTLPAARCSITTTTNLRASLLYATSTVLRPPATMFPTSAGRSRPFSGSCTW